MTTPDETREDTPGEPPPRREPRPASEPRHQVETQWGVVIPARDGVELSANLWLPVPLAEEPGTRCPAILEMIPYG